jgi:hypothetical protein
MCWREPRQSWYTTAGMRVFVTGSDGAAEDLTNPLPERGGYVKPPTLGGRMNVVGNKIWGNSNPAELIENCAS